MKDLPTEIFTALPVVVRVAETESFTKAARQLGMSPSGVSKAVSRLEERLGVRLFDRTTRKVAATEEGLRFCERCRQITADILEAQTELVEARAKPRGTVTASVPRELGLHVVRSLPAFQRLYPEVKLQLELTDRRVDVVGERVDVALRIGDDASNSHGRLIRRTIAHTRPMVCASPEYVRRNGMPETPEGLEAHNVYFFGSHRGDTTRIWHFHREGERREVTLRGNAIVDSGDALVELARQGDGVVAVFDFLAIPVVRAGELLQLLPDWQLWGSLPVSVVYPKHRRWSAKVTCFADFLEDTVARTLPLGAIDQRSPR